VLGAGCQVLGARLRVFGILFFAFALTGCASHAQRVVADDQAPLETFIAKVREASLAARPARTNQAPSVERTDPELSAASAALAAAPTAENHRRIAEVYAHLGVRDAAFDQFTTAIRLDPRDAGSYDGLARIWRDWGFPDVGLTAAHRAIYYAPNSPTPINTLGTLLVDLGQPRAARSAFERALALDPGAMYALNNLCYAQVLVGGDQLRAIERCRSAVAAAPQSATARNNLGLAYAAAGDFAAASREFQISGDAAAERYNMGVALLATGHYDDAASAFDAASVLRPWLTIARDRARQSRALATAHSSPGLR
jgi:tetratricopeptide (TPR) repeat protein